MADAPDRSNPRASARSGLTSPVKADVIASGKPITLAFGVADETAWKVGLACGGKIRVYVEPVTD